MTYIDALKLYNEVQEVIVRGPGQRAIKGEILDIIARFPIEDAEAVRHGEWEHRQGINVCSLCGRREYIKPPYCPYCGAKMDLI